jgi:tetratricopeptide (TPR) repeat protein
MKPILLLSVGCALLLSLPAHAALRGVALYERGNYARARRVLEEELRSPKLTPEERITARLYLAAALHASGAKEAASVQLEELVLTAPELEVDPVLFPPAFVELAESIRQKVEDERKRVEAERQRVEAERQRVEAERLAREQAARQPPPPVAPTPQETPPAQADGSLRLRPEVFGFVSPLGQKSYGLGGGLSLGVGAMEAGVRVLLGDDVGVGAEVGLVLGSGAVQPHLALRGTFVPGQPSYGGGAVVGLRLHPASRLTLLVDVGAEYFAVPNGYRAFVLTSSAGVGFDLL